MMRTLTLGRGGLSALALLITALGAHAQARYAIAALDESLASVQYVNDRGDVVGADAAGTALVCRGGVVTSLGRLPGGTFSVATAISNTGVVAGDGDTGNGRPQSWVNLGAGLINFFPNNGGNTHALFVGDSGFIGGFYTKSLSGWTSSWKAAIWKQNAKDPRKWDLTDLPVPAGGVNPKATGAFPFGFNQRSQAVGFYQNDQIGGRACFWDSNAARTMTVLDRSPEYGSSTAHAINDLGQIAGVVHPPFGSRPVVWAADAAHAMVALPMPDGDNYGAAIGINNLGHILGYSAYGVPGTWEIGPSRPVLWRDGGVYPLQSLLDPATGAGWDVTTAVSINHRGQILGMGALNGRARAFLMTPLP